MILWSSFFLHSFYSSLDIVVNSMVYLGLSKNDAIDRINGSVVQLDPSVDGSLRGERTATAG